jgi:hypothetical protein
MYICMSAYPLKSLQFYKVLKDFTSDPGFSNNPVFKKDSLIQYQKSESNLHDMIERIHFKDYQTNSMLIWNTRIENLHDHWQEYLQPVDHHHHAESSDLNKVHIHDRTGSAE